MTLSKLQLVVKRSFNAIKSHKEPLNIVKSLTFKTFENFKKNFGHQQTEENSLKHFKGQLKYLELLPDIIKIPARSESRK